MKLGIGVLQLLGTIFVLLNGPLAVRHGTLLALASPSHGVGGNNNGISGSNVQGPQLTNELPSRLLFSNSSGGSLPCSATGQPAPTIRWLTEDGDEAADVPRLRHVRQGDGSLVFLPFRADQFRRDVHEARYRCSASNAIGTVVSPQVHVTAVLDTNYDMRFSDKHVIAGNPVLLQCPIPSHLGDHVWVTSWQRVDGYVITRNTHGDDYVVTTDGQLYIREARDAEELLRYRCHTENTLTRRKKTSSNFVRLLLREPLTMQTPSIVYRSSRVQSDPGQPVDLLCVAEGFPVPGYSWYKRDGQRMVPLEPSMDIRQVAGVLHFREAEADDAGTYVCLASNSVGEAQVDLELVVTPKPWVTVTPAHVRAEVGHAAAFRCNASGLDWGVLDETSLEWRHNGRRLMPSTQQGAGMGRSRVLHLPSIRRQDQGMYQCFVRLSPKRTVQAAAELIVGDKAPKLKSAFEETTVRPGKPVSLRCVASGDPPPRITWLLDGVWPIDSRHGRVRVRTIGAEAGAGLSGAEVSSTLSISSAEVQDGGSYSCEASNYAGAASHSARVNVYGSIYVRALGNLSALAAATFSVQCPFGGYPFGHVYWEKDGRRLPLNQRQTVFPNGTLQIQGTDREHDQGQYTCTVHGPDSQIIHRTISLHVRSGPQITPFTFQANLHEGVRAGLTCLVHAGDPPIHLKWLRDGKPLVPGAHPDVSIMTDEGGFVSTLTLKRLSSRQNGNYTCRATNQYASAEHSAELLVKVPPTWTMEPNDTTAVSGRSVYVDCQASGVPQPHIRWKSASEPDSPASQFRTIISNSHIHILVNGTLSIRSVEPGDAGLYLCEASNGVGSGISRVLQLTVRSAPRFASKFTTVSVRRGEGAEVTCPAQGDSPIRFHWLKNNLPLNVLKDHRYSRVEDRSGDVTTSKITVQHAERSDNGVFTCQAANEFGEDSTSVQLTVQDVPDPPSDVDVREVGSRTARVTWSVPFTGNSPITQYVLHWKTADGPWQDTLTVSGLETKATMRGLLPTTSYHLRVRADNILGISDYSTPVEFTTSKEPPRFPPKNVQATATNTRTISVSFDNPTHTKADDQVEGFYVGYRELSSLDAFTFKTFDASPTLLSAPTSRDHASGLSEIGHAGAAVESQPHRLSYELTGLRRSTEYAVTVQAFNAKGAGPQSEVVRVRTLDFDPPSAPHLRIGGTTARSISVNWENEHLQEAPITGFSLYYKVEGSAGSEWHEVSVPHDRRAFTLTDLRCGTEYLVYIRAANRAGKGPQGETLSVRTNGGRPLEPDPSRLFEINSTFVVLHLDAWESGGCPVSYFVVQYRPEARAASPSTTSTEWTLHSNNVVPQQQLVQLADLAPGSWYTLLMSAHNDAGSTEVELSFATLTLTGELPSRSYELLDPQVTFYRHLTVTVPIVSAIVVLIIVVGVVCVVLRRRNYDPRQRIGDGMVVAECCDASKGDLMLAVSHESQAREPVYYPAPYATHNRSGTAAGPGSGQCNNVAGARECSAMDDPKSRTYDVPYPVKRLEMWDPSQEELLTCMEVYEKAERSRMSRTPSAIKKDSSGNTRASIPAGQEAIYRSSPFHISKPKGRRTRWRDDGDRSSGSENDAEDLLDEEHGGTIPQTLIVPLEKFSSWDLDATTDDPIRSWKKYPSAYEATSVRCAGEYTSIT